MSDEGPRSTPPNQRRGRGAPTWWAELERTDLPDDGQRRLRAPRAAPQRVPIPARRTLHVPAPSHAAWRTIGVTLVVLVVAAAIAVAGVGATSPRTALAALLIFGVPSVLASVAATIILRKHH